MDRLNDCVRRRRQEAIDEMWAGDRLRFGATVAVEIGPYTSEGEQGPVVIECEPDHVFFSGRGVGLRRVLGEGKEPEASRDEPGGGFIREHGRLSVAQIFVHAYFDAQQTIFRRDESTANGFGKTKVYESLLNFIRKAARKGGAVAINFNALISSRVSGSGRKRFIAEICRSRRILCNCNFDTPAFSKGRENRTTNRRPTCEGMRNSSRCFRARRFERKSHFFGAHEGTTDVPVLGTGIERDQSIAVLTVRLKSVTDFLGALSEYHRAFRASDFYFFVNHGMPQKAKRAFSYLDFKGLLMALST